MKFRKKPVIIEATQWFRHGDHPMVTHNNNPPIPNLGQIVTLEGVMDVVPGDWIIKGVKGEHYPCKPDIFEMTYERKDDKDDLMKHLRFQIEHKFGIDSRMSNDLFMDFLLDRISSIENVGEGFLIKIGSEEGFYCNCRNGMMEMVLKYS